MTISKVNQLKLILFKNDEPQDANPNTVSILILYYCFDL